MRIAVYADARSPIAIHWVRWFTERGEDIHWITSRDSQPPLPGLASFRSASYFPSPSTDGKVRRSPRYALALSSFLRHWVMPLRVKAHSMALRRALEEIQPEILHAMRIPLEGMIAARAVRALEKSSPRLALSIWGNDFTLHANASPFMKLLTRQAVSAADGLHADCRRDLRLAQAWGVRSGIPLWEAPGNGGIRANEFFPGEPDARITERFALPAESFFLVNPRGLRGYARTDTFFRAIPLVVSHVPRAHFLAVAMAGNADAEAWVRRLNIQTSVTLLPSLSPEEMASVFRLAHVTLSLTTHDGTPNTLLEAMACGSFPICGDIESIREWITNGENGMLVPPGDAVAVARAILSAMKDGALRSRAAKRNGAIIEQRAAWSAVMPQAENFYRRILEAGKL
jgi:glycosyltransferase involved in cell wall biosynthesis